MKTMTISLLWFVSAWCFSGGVGHGQEREIVHGIVQSARGTLLECAADGKTWRPLDKGDLAGAGRWLMAWPGSQGNLDMAKGGVRLTLWGNVPDQSSVPVLESVVRLEDNDKVDLDFTLDQGRVVLSNLKAKGGARVQVRFQKMSYDLMLEDASEIALEVYGRWPRGFASWKPDNPEEKPTYVLLFLVLKGQVELKSEGVRHALRAPPGPAYFHWDSVAGLDNSPKKRDKLPPWKDPAVAPSEKAKALQPTIEQLRRQLSDKSAAAVLKEALADSDSHARMLAIYGLAAMDDLPSVVDALEDPKHADARLTAILALRHWLGRGAHQGKKFYQFLVQQRKYKEAHAETVLELLHSFSDTDRSRPEVYETLIAFLRHSRLAVRELARWHLYRMVPDGRDIAYDAAGSAADRDKAHAAWKKLQSDGKLPPKGVER